MYNTLSRDVELFIANEPGKVGIYTCGPTVYNYAHIGNLRTYISEDILVKTLKAFGYQVKRVMNVTDVGHLESDADEGEDKLLKGAKRENKSVREIADFYEKAFFKDCAKLNIMEPDVVKRATDCISSYIKFIKVLEDKGYTYFANGNVYFDITKFPRYTELGRADLETQQAGARSDVFEDEHKKNPQDFVLWFTKSKFENQAMKWDSPWGVGYPGWHIECSVIALESLGPRLDIHCGGVDHIAVHHTNEIAQTESYTGEKWVNYWWHGEFLIDESGKMSKSKGEFINVDLLEKKGYDPLAYRYYVLGSHYRRQLAFDYGKLDQAAGAYRKLRERTSEIAESARSLGTVDIREKADNEYLERFYGALADDLNTANAIAELYGLLKSDLADDAKAATIARMDEVLSLDLLEPLKGETLDDSEVKRIEALIKLRDNAKAEKDYESADAIRDQLKDMGVVLKDSKDGTTWELKK